MMGLKSAVLGAEFNQALYRLSLSGEFNKINFVKKLRGRSAEVFIGPPSIAFVGSNPSVRAFDAFEAFTSDTYSGRVLRSWVKQVGLYFDHVHKINVSNLKTIGNRQLSKQQIDDGKLTIRAFFNTYKPTHVIALGKTAQKVLKELGIQHLEMPHPSGLNRKLNDKNYINEQLEKLRKYVNEPPKE